MSSAGVAPVRKLKADHAAVLVFKDGPTLFAAATEEFFRTIEARIEESGVCNIALSGGSTPKTLYNLIAERAAKRNIDWSAVHFFFGDERSVPPDHPDSNFGMVRSSLLKNGVIPAACVHRVMSENGAEQAAAQYDEEVRRHFGGDPRFDLIFLGMGPDGHTASLFPGTQALQVSDRYVVANDVPQMKTQRITFTYPTIDAARHVLFLVSGADKQTMLKSLLVDKAPLPANAVHPTGTLEWYVDEPAASALTL